MQTVVEGNKIQWKTRTTLQETSLAKNKFIIEINVIWLQMSANGETIIVVLLTVHASVSVENSFLNAQT